MGRRMKLIVGLVAIFIAVAACGAAAEAQQAKKVPRIGYIGSAASEQTASNTNAFRERLHELGYVEGQNVTIEYRYFEGRVERLPETAAELVRLKCDVIVTT